MLLAGSLARVSTDLIYSQDHLPWDGTVPSRLGHPPPITANITHLDTPTSHSDVGIAGGGFPQGLTLGCVMFTVKANWGSHHQNQIQDPNAEDAVCTLDAACKQTKLGLS